MLGAARFAALVGLLGMGVPTPSAAGIGRLAIECDPAYGAGGTFTTAIGAYPTIGDDFPHCGSFPDLAAFGDHGSQDGASWRSHGEVISDGTSVTARTELELSLPEGMGGSVRLVTEFTGLFRTPPEPNPVPVDLVFEIARSGGFDEGSVQAILGPGLGSLGSLDSLPDGEHHFPRELDPDATYGVTLAIDGTLLGTGAGAREITFYALPEPARALLLAAGAGVLALAARARQRNPVSR
jgi:hypothetical protein